MPQCELLRLLLNAALLSGQHLYLLLHFNYAAALRIGLGLGLAQCLFQIWQSLSLVFNLRSQSDGLIFCLQGLFCQLLELTLSLQLAL